MYRDLLLTEDQIHGELTYVSSITLEPGCSIGVHTHSGDNEMYYIYEGTGTYTCSVPSAFWTHTSTE